VSLKNHLDGKTGSKRYTIIIRLREGGIRMFIVSLLAGIGLLIFAFYGLKGKNTENVQNKIVKIGFILLGIVLVYAGIIDIISMFTDPAGYIEQRR
jgi:hypothetical protein